MSGRVMDNAGADNMGILQPKFSRENNKEDLEHCTDICNSDVLSVGVGCAAHVGSLQEHSSSHCHEDVDTSCLVWCCVGWCHLSLCVSIYLGPHLSSLLSNEVWSSVMKSVPYSEQLN
jgi:hypothetical protein